MAKKTKATATDAELAVLKVIWSRGPLSAKQITEDIYPAGAESEFIGEMARLAENDFEGSPPALQRRVLQRRLRERGLEADFALIESLRRSPARFISINRGTSVARDRSGKIHCRDQSNLRFCAGEIRLELSRANGRAVFGDRTFQWQLRPIPKRRKWRPFFRTKPGQELFDAAKIGPEIVLRHWRKGDRFQPIGLNAEAKLQDLFVNAKIPREQRHRLILAATASGKLFWVEGLRISENFKLTPGAKRTLVWTVQ